MIPFPAFRQAVHDHRVHKRDLVVLDALLDLLDFETFRHVSRSFIAVQVGMQRAHVGRAIWRLHRFGYLEVSDLGPEVTHRYQYRLCLQRRNPRMDPLKAA